MQEAQDGNEGAYCRLMREIRPIICRIIKRQRTTASESDCEDLLQEVLLKVHAAKATYDSGRPFMPWLKTVVMNQAIDFVRKQRRQRVLITLSDDIATQLADDSAHDAFNRYEAASTVRKLVSRLPICQRSAIELLKLRELSLSEATILTGMSASALKDSIHRALISLRVALPRATSI
ncbi:MAG: sigma-70 family RNA polymerase sigma factor [Xanthobacteraceae bacterium]|nr:sigma-70 family RNA polymerase sigma factor [Xanthobacteraceae bacterium]